MVAPARILVTGGAGFIGSHLCDRYINAGWDVLCLDNFLTGSRSNIRHLLNNDHFEAVRHDVVFPYFAEVDLVLNFACPASPIHYQRNAIKTIKTNIIGTMNMLGLAKRTRARFVQASTSEVYGDPELHPQPETYWGNVNPIGIRSCYDEGKRVAETLCFDYRRQHRLDARVVRIFNTYGPRMALNDGRVVSNFIVQALQGEPITIYGKGEQSRSFCYIDDLVDGLLKVAELGELAEPMNLGSDEEFTVMELAEEVLRQTASKSKLIFKPLPEDDPAQRKPDLTRARSTIGWKPKTSLKDGLAATIPWFRKALNQR